MKLFRSHFLRKQINDGTTCSVHLHEIKSFGIEFDEMIFGSLIQFPED